MTPAELLKYKNKLKLWRVLHPDFDDRVGKNLLISHMHCAICRKQNPYCFDISKKLRENMKTEEIKEIDGSVWTDWTTDNGYQCVEWIRKV